MPARLARWRRRGRQLLAPQRVGFAAAPEDIDRSRLQAILATADDAPAEQDAFEAEFAALVGPGEAISFAAARMGFYSLMAGLGIGPGDEVVLPGFTCAVMPDAVLRRGATPVYADIEPAGWGPDPASVAAQLSPRTALVVAQHSFGLPCRIAELVELARGQGALVLEDCAIALDSWVDNRPVGRWGDAALFSTDHTKPLSTLVGGLVYTERADLAAMLRRHQDEAPPVPGERCAGLRQQLAYEWRHYRPERLPREPLRRRLGRRAPPSFFELAYGRAGEAPYPARLPGFLAALGRDRVACWPGCAQRRRDLLGRYLAAAERAGLRSALPDRYHDPTVRITPLRLVYSHPQATALKARMDALVATESFWFREPVIGPEPPAALGYQWGSCPRAEAIGTTVINWPCSHPSRLDGALLASFERVHQGL